MWFKYAAVASLLASAALAQTPTETIEAEIASATASLPACAYKCLVSAVASGGCDISDSACQCGTAKAAIAKVAGPCILGNCTTSEALAAQKVGVEICSLVAAETVTPTPSTSTSTTSSSSTTATSTTTTSTSASDSSTSSSTSTGSSSTTSRSSTTSSSTSSASASATGNAGSQLEVTGLMAGAALLAMLAL